jgi:aldehyde:ferredoxin oxidoreductase
MSEAELDKVGEKIFNVERAIMVKEGRSKEYDLNCGVVKYLRDRPDTEGIRLDEDKFTKALEELYTLRGWDTGTGWPTKAKLQELRLKNIVKELEKRGRLP